MLTVDEQFIRPTRRNASRRLQWHWQPDHENQVAEKFVAIIDIDLDDVGDFEMRQMSSREYVRHIA